MIRASDPEVMLTILARLDQIEARLTALEMKSNSTPNLEARLLPLIAQRIGRKTFTHASLRQAAVAAGDVELADALDACGSARSCGRLLARFAAAGHAVEGLRLVRVNTGSPAEYSVSVSNQKR